MPFIAYGSDLPIVRKTPMAAADQIAADAGPDAMGALDAFSAGVEPDPVQRRAAPYITPYAADALAVACLQLSYFQRTTPPLRPLARLQDGIEYLLQRCLDVPKSDEPVFSHGIPVATKMLHQTVQ